MAYLQHAHALAGAEGFPLLLRFLAYGGAWGVHLGGIAFDAWQCEELAVAVEKGRVAFLYADVVDDAEEEQAGAEPEGAGAAGSARAGSARAGSARAGSAPAPDSAPKDGTHTSAVKEEEEPAVGRSDEATVGSACERVMLRLHTALTAQRMRAHAERHEPWLYAPWQHTREQNRLIHSTTGFGLDPSGLQPNVRFVRLRMAMRRALRRHTRCRLQAVQARIAERRAACVQPACSLRAGGSLQPAAMSIAMSQAVARGQAQARVQGAQGGQQAQGEQWVWAATPRPYQPQPVSYPPTPHHPPPHHPPPHHPQQQPPPPNSDAEAQRRWAAGRLLADFAETAVSPSTSASTAPAAHPPLAASLPPSSLPPSSLPPSALPPAPVPPAPLSVSTPSPEAKLCDGWIRPDKRRRLLASDGSEGGGSGGAYSGGGAYSQEYSPAQPTSATSATTCATTPTSQLATPRTVSGQR